MDRLEPNIPDNITDQIANLAEALSKESPETASILFSLAASRAAGTAGLLSVHVGIFTQQMLDVINKAQGDKDDNNK